MANSSQNDINVTHSYESIGMCFFLLNRWITFSKSLVIENMTWLNISEV